MATDGWGRPLPPQAGPMLVCREHGTFPGATRCPTCEVQDARAVYLGDRDPVRRIYASYHERHLGRLQTASHQTFGDISSWLLFDRGLASQLHRTVRGAWLDPMDAERSAYMNSDRMDFIVLDDGRRTEARRRRTLDGSEPQ